ncbi:hypothetical protein BY996DRAFT_215550 [Phakopsora pachyrhizi]|nr:hypothetical protein BY996DRAFT_215550 [Phakopsora pachyrhizi]
MIRLRETRVEEESMAVMDDLEGERGVVTGLVNRSSETDQMKEDDGGDEEGEEVDEVEEQEGEEEEEEEEQEGEEVDDDDDDDDDEEEEEEEEEDEEEEPLFKYQRLDGQIDRVFQKEDASAIATSTKILAIGTHSGMLYIHTNQGNFMNRFRPHSATIHDVKIDSSDQFVCTASMDGKVSILPISGNGDVYILDLRRPMRSIALEPLYFKHLNKRQFVTGGLAGNLTLHEKGWLGNIETVLHSGEGPVWTIEWKSHHIAWANDTGIRILDINTHQKVAHILRGLDEPRADLYPCHFYWENPDKLLVGWADTIRIISTKQNTSTSLRLFKVVENLSG